MITARSEKGESGEVFLGFAIAHGDASVVLELSKEVLYQAAQLLSLAVELSGKLVVLCNRPVATAVTGP